MKNIVDDLDCVKEHLVIDDIELSGLLNIPRSSFYKTVNADAMKKLYKTYHTTDPKKVIDRILEEKGLVVDDSYDKQYEKYKQFVKERGFEYKI